MKNLLLTCMFATLLSGCGGGGGNLSDLDRDFENSGQANEVIKQFADGSALVVTKGNLKSLATIEEPSYFFSITDKPDSLIETFNGAMNLQLISRDDFGGTNYFNDIYTGTNVAGKKIDGRSLGIFLDGSGNQVSINVATLNEEEVFFFTTGTLVNVMPQGKHTYSAGDVLIAFKEYDIEEAYDTITVAVDFDELKGSMVAETDTLFVSATDFTINASNGTFNGSDASIGVKGGADTLDADINGAFAGVGAAGIHGLVTSKSGDFAADECFNCGVAGFYSRRD